MTDNSVKLRMLITLHALFRHTDKNHRMNSVRLNEFLRPYGMKSRYIVLSDTVNTLQSFGIKIGKNSEQYNTNVWIEDRPLSDPVLKKLIFAVRTNPHLTQEQADEILESIKPVLTVYQEPLLKSAFKGLSRPSEIDKYLICSVIQDAIQSGKMVKFCTEKEATASFSPKYLVCKDNHLYMLGYNHTHKKLQPVDINTIQQLKLFRKHYGVGRERILDLLQKHPIQSYFE